MNNSKLIEDLAGDLVALEDYTNENKIDSYLILAVTDSGNYFYVRAFERNPMDLIAVNDVVMHEYKNKVIDALNQAKEMKEALDERENKNLRLN